MENSVLKDGLTPCDIRWKLCFQHGRITKRKKPNPLRKMVSEKHRGRTSLKGRKHAEIQARKSDQASGTIAPSEETIERKVTRDLRSIVRALWILGHSRIDARPRFEEWGSGARKTWRTWRISASTTAGASPRIQVPLHELPVHRSPMIPAVAAMAWRILSNRISQ
jgi:hypothetical protein